MPSTLPTRADDACWCGSQAKYKKPPAFVRNGRDPAAADAPSIAAVIARQAGAPTVLLGLREHIDAMLEANPGITATAIWQRLHDEHDATPSYPAVRTYITTRRTTRPPDIKNHRGATNGPGRQPTPPTLRPRPPRKKPSSGSCTWGSSKSDL